MVGKSDESQIRIAVSPQWRDFAHGQRDLAFVIIRIIAGGIPEETRELKHSAHTPRPQSLLQLLGVRGRIARRLHCLRNNNSRGLVLPMSAMHPSPLIDDDVGTKRADDSHQIFCRYSVPYFQSFVGAFRVAEIRRARKEQ